VKAGQIVWVDRRPLASTQATSAPPEATPLDSTLVDLLFQRANMNSEEMALDEVVAEEELEDDGSADDGGASKMVIHEFAGALVRLAWACYPNGASGSKTVTVGRRLSAMLEFAVLPACTELLDAADPMVEVLERPRVAAILAHYAPDLRQIFATYAAADQASVGALTSLDSMNLAELLYAFKEAKLLDDRLTIAAVTAIFALVNAAFEEEGDDGDQQELAFDEFLAVIARVVDVKVPLANRGGAPFEDTLRNWLGLICVPTFRGILKEKRRGVRSKTMSK